MYQRIIAWIKKWYFIDKVKLIKIARYRKIGFVFALLSLIVLGVTINFVLLKNTEVHSSNKEKAQDLLEVKDDIETFNQVNKLLSSENLKETNALEIEQLLLKVETNIGKRMENVDTLEESRLLFTERELLDMYWKERDDIAKGNDLLEGKKELNQISVRFNNNLTTLLNNYK